jgi:hypothetical protein
MKNGRGGHVKHGVAGGYIYHFPSQMYRRREPNFMPLKTALVEKIAIPTGILQDFHMRGFG